MTTTTPRYRIGPLDRLTIDGEHYRPVSSDHDGHVLCRESNPDDHVRYSHTDIVALHHAGTLVRDPDYFSYAGAQNQ